MNLQVKRFSLTRQRGHRFIHRIRYRITDVFGATRKRRWKLIPFQILHVIRLGKPVEIASTQSPKKPLPFFVFTGKADRLMPLRITTNVDIKPNIFGKCIAAAMSTHVIFPNVRSLITIRFQRFCNGDRFSSDILGLRRPFKFRLLARNTTFAKTIQVSNNVNSIVRTSRILSR